MRPQLGEALYMGVNETTSQQHYKLASSSITILTTFQDEKTSCVIAQVKQQVSEPGIKIKVLTIKEILFIFIRVKNGTDI